MQKNLPPKRQIHFFCLVFSPAPLAFPGTIRVTVFIVDADAKSEEQGTDTCRNADHGDKYVGQTGPFEEAIQYHNQRKHADKYQGQTG